MIGKYHQGLTLEKWASYGTDGMIGNIGSDISRAISARAKNDELHYRASVNRAIELIEMTAEVLRKSATPWRAKEMECLRELVLGVEDSSMIDPDGLEYADNYCMEFALRAQKTFIANHS
ncbi:hypothetical protein HYV44_03095 [Candidatus Microgenomates bacterium]|nr:hypothetical protein [Candidatus Microgenomates bacterium]